MISLMRIQVLRIARSRDCEFEKSSNSRVGLSSILARRFGVAFAMCTAGFLILSNRAFVYQSDC